MDLTIVFPCKWKYYCLTKLIIIINNEYYFVLYISTFEVFSILPQPHLHHSPILAQWASNLFPACSFCSQSRVKILASIWNLVIILIIIIKKKKLGDPPSQPVLLPLLTTTQIIFLHSLTYICFNVKSDLASKYVDGHDWYPILLHLCMLRCNRFIHNTLSSLSMLQ